jgi:diguanylate cyclase (GGDEF)-like protein
VNQPADKTEGEAVNAAGELARLSGQVDAMRTVLIRLLQDVVQAESRLDNAQAGQLLEANEQLVIAAMRGQAEAATATQALDEAAHSAEHDALTRLPNRVLLRDRLETAIAHAKRHRKRLGLLFLDINNFKEINDSFGHAAGDSALKLVARCLCASVRAADTVSRHGGDEFLVLLSEVSHPSDAVLVANKILALLNASGHVAGHPIRLTASIGISIYPDDGDDAIGLIERADAAMYRAKRNGLGSYAFHGDALVGHHTSHAPEPDSPPGAPPEPAPADPESRHAQLQEANERLVLAALNAQELQAAAESAQRRQTQFLALVAHELGNPLAPIRIAAAQLGRARTDEVLMPRAQAIVDRQAAHMSRLVGDLLDVARGGTGMLTLERRTVDLAGIIDAAVGSFRPAMNTRRQRFTLQMPEPPIDVHGDPARLAQVLGNLLDNASRYTPEGNEIGLSVVRAGDSIVITVSDSGIGITEEGLRTVFDPFVQDTHAIGIDDTGAGIGLTVVRELVEAHGGSVVANSAGRGRGSQFVVTLPAELAPGASGD